MERSIRRFRDDVVKELDHVEEVVLRVVVQTVGYRPEAVLPRPVEDLRLKIVSKGAVHVSRVDAHVAERLLKTDLVGQPRVLGAEEPLEHGKCETAVRVRTMALRVVASWGGGGHWSC